MHCHGRVEPARHRGVVQKTVAAHEVRAGVMTRGARRTEDAALASGEQRSGARCRICGGSRRDPRAADHGCFIVHRIKAKPRDEIDGLDVTAQRAHGPCRWKRLLVLVRGVERKPLLPGRLDEAKVPSRVHAAEHFTAVDGRGTELMTSSNEFLAHPSRSRGRLEARPALAAEELICRRVQLVLGGKERDHMRPPGSRPSDATRHVSLRQVRPAG